MIPSVNGVNALKVALKSRADYLLVDARTGITDVGTLALFGMAEKAVCLFTTTPESVQGSAADPNGPIQTFETTREPRASVEPSAGRCLLGQIQV